MKQKKTIWDWMKSAVDAVKALIGIIPSNIKIAAARSLDVTTRLKNVLENPVTDIVTAIIPGDLDDKIVAALRDYLRRAIPYLSIVSECSEHDDVEAMLQCWVARVKELHPDIQNAMLHKLASLLTAYQDNEALRQRLYDLYVQMVYIARKG